MSMKPGKTAEATYEITQESPVLSIVEAVAAETGRDMTALPPLGNEIDADALGRFLQHSTVGVVEFEWEGVEVRASCDGDLELTDVDG